MRRIVLLSFISLIITTNSCWAAGLNEFAQEWRTLVGERLRYAFDNANSSGASVNQKGLASYLGISQTKVSRIMRGQQGLTVSEGIKAADFLNTDPEWLLALHELRERIQTESNLPQELAATPISFQELVQYTSNLSPVPEPSCDKLLTAYTSEALTEELTSRGWTVRLTRERKQE